MANLIQKHTSHSHHREFKCLQINTAKSKNSTWLLAQYCVENKLDIIMMQEPYTRENELTCFESKFELFYLKNSNTRPKSAVVVLDPNFEVLLLAEYSSSNITACLIRLSSEHIVILSCYFEPDSDIERYLYILDTVLHQYKNQKIIMCGDFNARSSIWHDRVNDKRGKLLYSWISQHNLNIENKDDTATFSSHQGESCIDMTLTNEKCTQVLSSWTVISEHQFSDHRPIQFCLSTISNTIATNYITEVHRYNLNRANWSRFKRELLPTMRNTCDKMQAANMSSIKVNCIVDTFMTSIKQVCNKVFKRRRNMTNANPWWTTELKVKRNEVNSKRRRFQRSKNQVVKGIYYTEYILAKKEFEKGILLAKTTSWKQYCSRNSQDIFGNFLKVIKDDKSKARMPSTLLKPNGTFTSSIEETNQLLLDHFCPTNIATKDLNSAMLGYSQDDDPLFSKLEIKAAFLKIDPKKSPGKDLLEGEIVLKTYEYYSEVVENVLNLCFEHSVFPDVWKFALLRLIPKSGNRPPQ